MRDDDGGIIALPLHGASPRDSHTIDPGGGHRQRGTICIRGVILIGVEVSDVTGGRVTSEGKQPGKTQRIFHIPKLKGVDCIPTGGPGASPTVRPLWDAHVGGAIGETQEYGQIR